MAITYLQNLTHFTNFLTAYVHTLLYLRSLYPQTSFLTSRFHNTPVHQSRHPAVCEWIRDAISAVRTELLNGSVARIGIVVFCYAGEGGTPSGSVKVMERYMMDVSRFPVLEKGERNMEVEWEREKDEDEEGDESSSESDGHAEAEATGTKEDKAAGLDTGSDVDMSEQFRAALVMLTTRCSQLTPLPKNCSFNICMELKDEADVDPPLGHPQPWIPAQPSLQKTGRKGADIEENRESRKEGQDLGGVRVTPIRTVEAGVFRFETWVEEGRAKFEHDEESAKSSLANSGG